MWLFCNWSKTALQCCIGNCHYFWEKKKLIFLEAKREAVLPGILSLPAMMLTMNRLVSVCVKVQDESSYSFTQQMFDNRVYFLGCSKRRARKLSWRAGLALGTILEKELATGYTREREASSAWLEGQNLRAWWEITGLVLLKVWFKDQPHQNY